MIPTGAFGGGKPAPAPRVVNTDFYRGKVKSIYEREPLFQVTLLQYHGPKYIFKTIYPNYAL